MDALAKHTQVLTARQIAKTLQGRLADRLSTLATAYGLTLPAPNTSDAYWSGPYSFSEPPGEVYCTPSIGVQWQDSTVSDTGGSQTGYWQTTTPYRVIIATDGDDPKNSQEVAQSYASAVGQILCGFLFDDCVSFTVTANSIGEGIPITSKPRPIGTSAGQPTWWDDNRQTILISEVVIEVTQYEVMR